VFDVKMGVRGEQRLEKKLERGGKFCGGGKKVQKKSKGDWESRGE